MKLETTIDRLTAQAAVLFAQARMFTKWSKQESGDLKADYEGAAVCYREDAGEMPSAVNHLRRMLPTSSKPAPQLTDIAKAMYKRFCKQAVDSKNQNPRLWLNPIDQWEVLEDAMQLCWIAAAGEAVAQVAAMNATGQAIAD